METTTTTASVKHYLEERLWPTSDRSGDPATYRAHCGHEVSAERWRDEMCLYADEEVTCEACVAVGFDRGQKQARTLRLNKIKKEAAAKAALDEKARGEKIAAARTRYGHLRRLRVLPIDYREKLALLAQIDDPLQKAICETVADEAARVRSELADIAREVYGLRKHLEQVLLATPEECYRFDGVRVDASGRMLSEIGWLTDTGKLKAKKELLERLARTVATMAWAAGYIIPDMHGDSIQAEHARAQQLKPEQATAGQWCLFDLKEQLIADGPNVGQQLFDDEGDMWLEVARRLTQEEKR